MAFDMTFLNTFCFALTVTAVAGTCLSSVSWEDPRVDVFGASSSSIWHKFYTGWDWQPSGSFEQIPAPDASCPSVSSWGAGRLDIVYVNASGGNVLHKYYEHSWGPSWEGVEDLGGNFTSLTTNSWGSGRLDIVARTPEGAYMHKAWTGSAWYPAGKGWEDFGGNFEGPPAAASWSAGRLDIVGVGAENGTLLHKYWQDGWSSWEDLKGGPFVGAPSITSWGPGRFDIWAVKDKDLNHLFWDGSQYRGWEKLGGVSQVPQVVHWNATKIDIIAKLDDGYFIKSWDGDSWNPADGWSPLASSFSSEPSVVAKRGTNFLSVFGIDKNSELRSQVWTGYDWQPAANKTWSLGLLKGSEVFRPEEL
ncbi:hypothetical protein B0I35DRAFT_1407 [Stachybotrys elegans]|uniref:Fucose-specific lectin n=1 Tax=Stachybotrys elegans TaxID=80388 RepID=A0A8K0WWU2_9HYPO|nr:hypothetical protein B0I35DRAFT_1407 [Stachybotrys elegans]